MRSCVRFRKRERIPRVCLARAKHKPPASPRLAARSAGFPSAARQHPRPSSRTTQPGPGPQGRGRRRGVIAHGKPPRRRLLPSPRSFANRPNGPAVAQPKKTSRGAAALSFVWVRVTCVNSTTTVARFSVRIVSPMGWRGRWDGPWPGALLHRLRCRCLSLGRAAAAPSGLPADGHAPLR